MVVSEGNKPNRSVRPKLLTSDSNDSKIVGKVEKKHRLKQRFEVIKKLGQGTYGKVQLAINKETGQEVAIKTIKKSKVESEQDLVRIRREIQIMSSIQHPHIIHIFEVFENKDKIVLVMQHASGGELYDYVSYKKVLSDSEARRLFRQIATAIYYCHKNKICHRDLKLENILLDEKGNAKIADFGLSNVFDERHFLQTFCGSPLYASPEIVKGSPYYGPEVDCWSLGVLLYTLVYGAMPFDGSNFKRLVKQISESNYFEPKEKSDASALIKKLLTPNPNKRATIIDICTDCWVNSGFEHSLLQVSEDMANLTPVRLDILLQMAPVSPSAEPLGKNPFDITQNKNIKVADNKLNDSIDNLGESADDKSSSSLLDNSINKRQASTSFDQSLTSIPTPSQTQVPKKKKTKKSKNDNSVPDNSNDTQKDNNEEIKENNKIENNEQLVQQSIQPEMEMNETKTEEMNPINDKSGGISEVKICDNVSVDQSQNQSESLNTQTENLIEEVIDSNKETNDSNVCEQQTVICEVLEDKVNESSLKDTDTDQVEVKHEDKDIAAQQVRVQEGNQNLNEEKICVTTGTVEEVDSQKQLKNDTINREENDKPIALQEQNEKREEQNGVQNEDKKKPKSRSNSCKRPGKLSIPNLWDKTEETEGSPTKSFDSKTLNLINESKKLIENKSDKKVPFIPVGFRVSDAKRAFERRCSVPANSLLMSNSLSKRRDSKPNTEVKQNEETKVDQRPKAPKLSTRSMSLNEQRLESPKKVKELNITRTDRNEVIESVELVKKIRNEQISADSQKDARSDKIESISVARPVSPASPSSTVTDKEMAKDILKKSIAKAKLMEKRQNSSGSGGNSPSTTPLVSIENSDLSIIQEPSFFKTPKPYIKSNIEKPTIDTPIEIKTAPNLIKKINDSDVISKLSDSQIRESDNVSDVTQNRSQEGLDSPLPQQTKPMPIARSYKKVTFTKEGACVTETGKIYSSEGADGSYTRVEKKSKVTHFPTIEDESPTLALDNNNTSFDGKPSLQKSDSQSSSGSVDIFDDIFDDHWSGDSIFSNMKSLFHGISGRNNRKTRRRSRAESCERNASDWFPSINSSRVNNSNLTDQESDNDECESSLPSSIWPTIRPQGSVFDKSSIFSRHFSRDLDKDFGFDDSKHPFHEFSRSLSKDRSSLSSRIHPTSFKVVFGPQTSVRSDISKRDHDSDDISRNALRNSMNKFESIPKTKLADHPSRTSWSREYDSMFSDRDKDNTFAKHDSFDSSRKRVEQWLHSDNNEDNDDYDRSTPFSKYATVGPRGVRRYLRTISGRSNDNQCLSNSGLLRNSSDLRTSGSLQTNPLGSTVANDSTVEMRFSLNPLNSSTNLSDSVSISNCQTSMTCEPSEPDDHQSNIAVPESSSLLEQLRMHGYRNIVSQRLSGSSLYSDLDSSLAENDINYKRGKNILNSSESVLNENANACECMDKTNPMATTTHATASTDNDFKNNEQIKASESVNSTTEVELSDSELRSNTQLSNDCLKQILNQQNRTSRISSTHTERSITSGDLPECNQVLNTNKAINNDMNLKETVQERIRRKSYYSRFNDDRQGLKSRLRRRSFIDSDDVGSALGSAFSSRRSSNLRSNSFRNSLSLDDHSFESKSASSDWFNRMESRASQLMDDLVSNNRLSLFNGESQRSRELNDELTFPRSRRSASTTRSSLSSSRSHRSDIDAFLNSHSSPITNSHNNDANIHNSDNLMDELKSPTEVLRRAIDILSQKD